MCRDGFNAECDESGCVNRVTCRDRPRHCEDHKLDLWAWIEAETVTTLAGED